MTPPTITGAISPAPDTGGYNSGPVTVTFTCADALSGVASCSSPVSVATEGTTTVPGSATDVAGNTATLTVTVNISFNFFKIRTWQTGPNGNAKSPSGKCLDYGASPSGNGAAVFLNDCSSAHAVRVYELGPTSPNSPPGTPCASPRIGSAGTPLCHEVLLFAGNLVIGVHNPQSITTGGAPALQSRTTDFPPRWRQHHLGRLPRGAAARHHPPHPCCGPRSMHKHGRKYSPMPATSAAARDSNPKLPRRERFAPRSRRSQPL